MKRFLPLFILTGLVYGQEVTIAVFDFQNNGLEQTEVKILTDRLQSELVKIGRYRFVERSKIDDILKEQKFQMSGCVEECLIDIGKMLGATQIIIGSFGKLGNFYTVSAKLIDAETGEIKRAIDYDIEGELKSLLIKGMKEIAAQLILNKFSKVLLGDWYADKPLQIDEKAQFQEIQFGYKDKLGNDEIENLYQQMWYNGQMSHSIEFYSNDDASHYRMSYPAEFDWIIEDNFITIKITWETGMFGGVGKEYTIEIVELYPHYLIFKTVFGIQKFKLK